MRLAAAEAGLGADQFTNSQDPTFDVYRSWHRAAAAFDGEVPAKIRSEVESFKDSVNPTTAAEVVVACVRAGYLTKREANFG
jgi:hypothetical protein